MGYYVDVTVNNLIIKLDNLNNCRQAILDLHKDNISYSWVSFPGPNDTLVELLYNWRYSAEYLENGDIQIFDFNGEKLGDDEYLFRAIAPFVIDTASIEYRGEDGCMWRYVLQNGIFTIEEGEVVWNEV